MSEETISNFFPVNAPNLIKVNLTQEEIERLEKDLHDKGYAIYTRKKIDEGWANMNERISKQAELIKKQDELIDIYKRQIEVYKEYMDNMDKILKGDKDAVATQTSTKNWTEEGGFKKAPSEKKTKSFKDFLSDWFWR